jgi:Cdc6-like AAA superfamily ATPase
MAKELALMAGGDARTAIQALKRGAVNAGQRDGSTIDSHDARSGWQNGAELKREYTVSLLNDHQRAVFRILQEFGEMTSARLWQEYLVESERVGLRVIAPRTFSHYMTKLEMAGLVEARKAQAKGNVRVFRVLSLKGDAARDES